jgi:integrase
VAAPCAPQRLRAFVLTVLVVNELVALALIAALYSHDLDLTALALGATFVAMTAAMRAIGVRSSIPCVLLGVAAWVALYESGVEPVVLGLALGLLFGARPVGRPELHRASERFRRFREQPTPQLERSARHGLSAAVPPNERLLVLYHPWTSYAVVPLFALANAGIAIDGELLRRAAAREEVRPRAGRGDVARRRGGQARPTPGTEGRAAPPDRHDARDGQGMEVDCRRARHRRIDRHLPRQARRRAAHAALRPVVAALTLAGLRVSELCALNCEHVDLARRELRVLDAKTPAGVRCVDIHDDLQEELAAYKAARGATWKPGAPAFVNARGKRWTRNAIAQHVIPPALEGANRQRTDAGLPAIREEVTPHTLRYTCIASLFAAGADQEYVADQVGHEDVTTTNRIYRYVLQRRRRGEIGRRRQLAMHQSAVDVGRPQHAPTQAQG